MKGLLIKDFYNLRQIRNTYLMIVAVLLLYCVFTSKMSFVPMIPILIFSTSITATFTMDNKVNWERLAISGPIERKQIVASKFALIVIMVAAGVLIGSVFAIPSLINKSLPVKTFIEMVSLSVNIALCAGGILIGSIYIFSNTIEKIELLTIVSYAISVVITLGLGTLIGLLGQIISMSNLILTLIETVLILIIFYISYKVSILIYSRKDFL